jgi:hypothetical protein
MRRMGTPGCIAADLRLLNAGSAEHPALDLPDWLRLWPMLFSSYPLPDDYSRQRTDRASLRLQLARELCGRSSPPWWFAPKDGAIGQATAAGLWTKELSSQLRGAMPARRAAQLHTSHFWHAGVLASSALSCRATTTGCNHRPEPTLSVQGGLYAPATTRALASEEHTLCPAAPGIQQSRA